MVRNYIAILCMAVMSAGAISACNGDDDSCTFECDVENATRCEGQIIQTCRRSGQGCLTWVSTTDCQANGLFCDDTQGLAQCTDECQDLCSSVGETQCRGTEVQTCYLGDEGCLIWELERDCAIAGDVCEDDAGNALCVQSCEDDPPAPPSGPQPGHGAVDVDAAGFEEVSWEGSAGAAHYEVYFGQCPAPLWPMGEFIPTSEPRRTGLSIEESTQYCWRVVAFSAGGCRAEGPEWSFTSACSDPEEGPPTVRSGDQSFAPLTSGSYQLVFSEPVQDVADHLTWTPVTGSGTLGSINQVDPSTYDVSFHGASPGDVYTLTVGTGVTDHCGHALEAPVSIQISIDTQQGDTCDNPQDITGASFPYGLVGEFEWDGLGGTCDTTATNTVFFQYTPATTGTFRFDLSNATTTAAFSRLAIFEGTGCSPYGTELFCLSNTSKTISGTVDLNAGTSYLLLFYTDGDSYTMVSPQITVTQLTFGPGESCSSAVDITSETFPFSMTGTFSHTFPGGSCSSSGTNSVFYTYTPTTSGSYKIDTVNNTTTGAFTRIAVYQGAACSPFGSEVACVTSSAKTGSLIVDLQAAETYLIQVYTDGASYTMVDPEITVAFYIPDPGETCSAAVDLNAETLPYSVTASYDWDGPGGSCGTSAYNAVFYTYTPDTTGGYVINAQNNTTTSAYTRIAVYETDACSPFGTERACVASSAKSGTAIVDLEAGTTYLIQFYTSSNSYTMVNPEIDVYPYVAIPGDTCNNAADLSGETFPYTLTGSFIRQGLGGACSTTAYNMAWFTYTPATTGWYEVDVNNQATGTLYSRLAIFEGTDCETYGDQLACVTASAPSASVPLLHLEAGTTYSFVFYTGGANQQMQDPVVTIAHIDFDPGEACETALDLTSATFPHAISGTFDYDFPGGSCATTGYNSVFYTYTPATSGDYRINTENHTTTSAYTRIAVYEGSGCSPYGTEVACVTSSSKTGTAIVSLVGGTSYIIQVYTSSNTYTTVNPEISIAPFVFQPGEACSTAVDVTSASLPHTVNGTFEFFFEGGSCNTNGNNSVFFVYTAASSGSHTINLENQTTTNAWSRMAVYEGTGCSPRGAELGCETNMAKTVSTSVDLVSGTSYLIQFYTDGSSYTMVDPIINITGP